MSQEKFTPYEKSHKLEPLCFCLTVVNDEQAPAICQIMSSHEVMANFISYGKGTANNDFYDVLGVGEARKQVILTVIKKSLWPVIKEDLEKRFGVSEMSKGIAYTVDIDSLAGVYVYKMLANEKGLDKLPESKKKEVEA